MGGRENTDITKIKSKIISGVGIARCLPKPASTFAFRTVLYAGKGVDQGGPRYFTSAYLGEGALRMSEVGSPSFDARNTVSASDRLAVECQLR